jgi:YD repeat-containing protein
VLASATDAAGGVTGYAYDPAFPGEALMVSRTRPAGNTPFVHAYDGAKRAISETSARGHTTTLAYSPSGSPTTVTDPLANAQAHAHAAGGKLTSFQDEGGTSATMQYDAQDRRRSVTDRLGKTTSWTRHAASGRIASITESDGSLTSFGYTARIAGGLTFFDLTSIARPGGIAESHQYDASGNLVRTTDGAGGIWTYAYNGRGQLLSATDPEGGVSSFTYNADGTLATHQDPAGNGSTFTYDALRRAIQLERADGAMVHFTYDALDRLTTLTDELSRTTSFGYDANGNLTSLTDPSSETWSFAYDELDRPTGALDPQGNQALVAYDERGRIAELTNGAGETTSFAYDARGRPISITDGLGEAWAIGSDLEGILSSLQDPGLASVTYASDSRGRITKATTPLGRSTGFTWDAHGHLTRITAPSGKATSFGFDKLGLHKSATLPGPAGTASVARDGTGLPVEVTYPGGRSWQYAYGAQGLLEARIDPLGRATTATHDERNRVDEITFPAGLGSATLGWSAAGELEQVDFSDGTSLHFDYDANGRIVDADGALLEWDSAGRISRSNGIDIGRDAAGRVESVTLAPGKVVSYTYDGRGLVATVSDWVGGTTAFEYDQAARLVSIARPNGIVTRYTYDADSRLTGIAEVSVVDGERELSAIKIDYDNDSFVKHVDRTSLLTALLALGKTNRQFDAAGQVQGWTYDGLGQLLDDGVSTYTWDLAGRLRQRDSAGSTRCFDYDGFDNLIVESNAIVTKFGRNYALGGGGVVSILEKDGQDVTYYVHAPDGRLLYSIEAPTGDRRFFHFDERSSTSFLSDDSAAITDAYAYDPYGKLLGKIGFTLNPFTFLGQVGGLNAGTDDLYFLGSSPYNPETGLFLGPNLCRPFDARAGNPYSFVPHNPVQPLGSGSGFPTPRFVDTGSVRNLGIFNTCATNLLFPFVTNQAGFDTGLAISNTSSDPFGTAAPSTVAAPSSSFPSSIPPSLGNRLTPGFQASVIERSQLEYAHGHAFISDLGAQRLAQGYLALALEYPTRPAESGAFASDPEPNRREAIEKFRAHFPQVQAGIRLRQQLACGLASVIGLGARMGWWDPFPGRVDPRNSELVGVIALGALAGWWDPVPGRVDPPYLELASSIGLGALGWRCPVPERIAHPDSEY